MTHRIFSRGPVNVTDWRASCICGWSGIAPGAAGATDAGKKHVEVATACARCGHSTDWHHNRGTGPTRPCHATNRIGRLIDFVRCPCRDFKPE